MEHIVKKVIMASAGTGKTYRLSLEFIALLLKYKDYAEFDFSQIVVMTFTRKATAEIREKILDFLQELANEGAESAIIISNLEKISGYKWQTNDREYIANKLLREILQRKDLLQVSTIDSFTTNIFKSMIVPYLRIKDFTIDNNSNDEIMPLLLEFILSDEVFPIFQPLLQRINIRTVEDSQGFIKSLIANRWVLDYLALNQNPGIFMKSMNLDSTMIKELQDNNWQAFKTTYLDLVADYNTLVFEAQDKPWHKLMLKDYKDLAMIDEADNVDLVQVFASIFAEPSNIIRNIEKFFAKPLPFTKSGKKEFKEITLQMEEKFVETIISLSDFYVVSEIIPKQQEVIAGWKMLLDQYDKLKFNLGKFTYNDVTFYTYKYLYEESLSLIDRERGIVTNLFYEQLVSRFRFLLIDEFQDTSFNQFSILIPIINELTSGYSVKDYSGVIIVGDPKQSIYGWRGGERGIMELMPEKLQVQAEDLTQCFRSTQAVINLVNRLFTDANFRKVLVDKETEWAYSPVTAKNWNQLNNCYNEEKEEGGELFYWEYNASEQDTSSAEAETSEENEEDKQLTGFAQFAHEISLLHQAGKIEWGQTAILVRTGDHADKIANELNKLNIPNSIDSSGKLLEHKAVEILLLTLKFKLLQDRFSLLQFLRSDLVLLDSPTFTEILKVLHNHNSEIAKETEFAELRKFTECEKLLSLVNTKYLSQAQFIREVINSYDFNKVCHNEIDWKNIYTFLELIISFEMAKLNTKSFDLFGFMEYCQQQLAMASEILQEGLQLENSISILTVHKSKGLGFKNVFLYWQLSNRKPPNLGNEFKLVYSFDKRTYTGLNDFLIYTSATDEKALKNSQSSDLLEEFAQRELIEAIDVFYVALTRAENKLGLFFYLKSGKADFVDYMANLKDEAGAIAQLIIAYKDFFRENGGDNLSNDKLTYFHYLQTAHSTNLDKNTSSTDPKQRQINYLKQYLTDYAKPLLKENRPIENMKKVYLEDRHQLFGNVAHEFLTYIKYGDEHEHSFAKSMVLKRFGSLLSESELIKVISSCHTFIKTNPDIFSHKWDKVFNEKTVFDKSKEYRIDRMMVDTMNKKVMIIDFKREESMTKNR